MEGHEPSRRRGVFRAPAKKGKSEPVSDERILAEMREMISEGVYLTDEGKPDTEALSDRLDFRVSAKVRDLLMKEM